jgi:hypothetical protein
VPGYLPVRFSAFAYHLGYLVDLVVGRADHQSLPYGDRISVGDWEMPRLVQLAMLVAGQR